jgi:hypothetical protein
MSGVSSAAWRGTSRHTSCPGIVSAPAEARKRTTHDVWLPVLVKGLTLDRPTGPVRDVGEVHYLGDETDLS